MRRMVFAVIALALWGAPAFAQPAPWQPERLTAGWTFTPGFVAGTMWDSNVTIRSQGNPQTQAWNALLSPRGELDFNGRRTRFNTGYAGALEEYRELHQLNRYEQRSRFEVRHQRTERLELVSGASYTVMPTTDRLELGAGSLPFVDIGSRLFDASGGFLLTVSPRMHVQGEYKFQDVRFDRSQVESTSFLFLRGGHSHSPAASAMYDLTRRLSVGGAWEYRHADLSGGEQAFDVQNSTGELAYKYSETTSVSGGAGIAHLSVSNTGLTTQGFTFHGGVEHKEGRVELSARYVRAFLPTFGFGGLTANQLVSVGAMLPFAMGRYYVSGGVTYSRTQPVEVLGVGFRLDSLWTNAAVGYQIARWLRAEGFYTGTHQNSSARGLIDRTRVGIQFVTFKPVRIE